MTQGVIQFGQAELCVKAYRQWALSPDAIVVSVACGEFGEGQTILEYVTHGLTELEAIGLAQDMIRKIEPGQLEITWEGIK